MPGAVRSTAHVAAAGNGGATALPPMSAADGAAAMASWRVPSPDPVETDTILAAPEPVMPLMPAPVSPPTVRTKFEASTPVTGSLKVTVKSTDAALVGDPPTRTIDRTVGGS